jgi:hypothetical protein
LLSAELKENKTIPGKALPDYFSKIQIIQTPSEQFKLTDIQVQNPGNY